MVYLIAAVALSIPSSDLLCTLCLLRFPVPPIITGLDWSGGIITLTPPAEVGLVLVCAPPFVSLWTLWRCDRSCCAPVRFLRTD